MSRTRLSIVLATSALLVATGCGPAVHEGVKVTPSRHTPVNAREVTEPLEPLPAQDTSCGEPTASLRPAG